jgi:anti-sigma factor RsiW
MSEPRPKPCESFAEALDLHLDGELGGARTMELEEHLESCEACRDELALAAAVRDGLRRLPSFEAPRPAVARVLETARAEAESREHGFLDWLRSLSPRPALVATTAAALLVALVLTLYPDRSSEPTLAGDEAAIAQATLEAKLALAHFARANRKIGLGLGQDVLHDRVVQPTSDGLARSLGAPGGAGEPGAGSNERG